MKCAGAISPEVYSLTKSQLRSLGTILLVCFLLVSTTVLAAPYGSRTLTSGSFGGDVVELQRRLTSLGYDVGKPDGIFGSRTRSALIRFQRDFGLVPDGLAGKWTYMTVDRAYTWQHGHNRTVRKGDSLWLIARDAGTSVETLRWLNRLQDDMLYPGQVLRVPGPIKRNPPPAPKPTAPVPSPKPKPSPVTPKPAPPAPKPAPPPAPKPQPQPQPTPQPSDPAPTPPTAPVPDGGSEPGQPSTPGADTPGTNPSPPTPPSPDSPTDPTPPIGTPPGAPTSPLPGTGTPPVGSDAPIMDGRYLVLGYYAEDYPGDSRSLNSLKNSLEQVDLVVNFQLKVDAKGTITTGAYPALMEEAARTGIPVQGLLHNLGPNGFDSAVARAVLSDPDVRESTIQNLISAAQTHKLSGINVDIENVPPDQRHQYTEFVRLLSLRLKPLGLGLTLSIPAKTFDDTRSSWSGAFDYKALGQHADYIVPMAYDEHLPGFQAGPVASLGWVEKVAAFAASQIPPEKVLLGVAAYGYDWQKGTTTGRGLSVPAAMNLALKNGAQVEWNETAQVPYFTYVSGGQERVVYFENARSLKPKLELVRKYNLGGIGIWRLGLEEPSIWSAIQSELGE